MKSDVVPCIRVDEKIKPLEQHVVVCGQDDLLPVAGEFQQGLHQIPHQLGVEVGFRLVPQQRAGGAWIKAAITEQALQNADLAEALGRHAAGK